MLSAGKQQEIERSDKLSLDTYKVYRTHPGLRLVFANQNEFIKRQVGIENKPVRVLDLGCGIGHFISCLYPTNLIVGTDISFVSLSIARDLNRATSFLCSDAEFIPFKDSCFDFVIMRDALHHLYDFTKCLKEIRRVLKGHGKVAIYEPRNSFCCNLGRRLCRLFGMETETSEGHHIKTKDIEALIKGAGFAISYKDTLEFIAYPLSLGVIGSPVTKSVFLTKGLIILDRILSMMCFNKVFGWKVLFIALPR